MTCLGINNEGYLRYDYYHEDLGQNDAVGQTHVFNGYDSVLWNNFAEAFKDKIQQTYSSWRSGDAPLLSYDNVIKYFITNQSDKWSISIYNEDAEYKYISMYRNNDNPEFLYQVKGTGEEHLKYFIKNRLMYCDSKWQTGDFINKDTNTILMRLNSPDGIEDDEIKPDMTIKLRTFSNMYTGVRYGTNGVMNSQYTDRGQLVSIKMPEGEDPNNLDTYIYGANEISELEDLSLLYPNLLNISAASKLTKLTVGNSHPNYRNDVLKTLSFSNNRLLKEVNICNCTGLTNILDFSLCPDIQYIYATGSKISGVQLPDSGFLKILHLPSTISNITFVNQHHIEEFKCEGYGNLTTIKVENSENVPIQNILLGCDSSVLASVSIKNVDWNADSEENLRTIIDKLISCRGSVIEGSVYLPTGTVVSDELKVIIHQNFPNLNVIDDNPVFYIDYYNYDNTIWDTEMVRANDNAVGPAKGTPADIIQELQGLRHLFVSWKTLPTNVNKNYQVDALWQTQYAIKYYNESELLYSYWANQGSAAKDPIDYKNTGNEDLIAIPRKSGSVDIRYVFNGWDNLPANIYKSVSIYALFANVYPVRYYATDSATTPHYVQWIKEGESAYDPIAAGECNAPADIVTANKVKYVFSEWLDIPHTISAITNVYCRHDTYWAARFYNGNQIYLVAWVLEGTDVPQPVDYFENYVNPTKASTAQYDYIFSSWDGNYKNITEYRDYTAVYTNVVRKYNVYFYNDTKLLQTIENVPYGGSAKYTGSTPTKRGVDNPEEYVFKGWMPEAENITGDTYCYALFKFTGYLFGKLGANSEYGTVDEPNWDKINAYWDIINADVLAYNEGTLSESDFKAKYMIGGRMLIPLEVQMIETFSSISYAYEPGVYTPVDVEIAAYNHDKLADGTGMATLTFFCKDLPKLKYKMNIDSTNAGGYSISAMREFVNVTLFEKIPEKLQQIIKPVIKISDGGVSNSTLVETTDSMWIASGRELCINSSEFLPGQGASYSLIFSDNASRKKYITDNTQAGGYWTRSSHYSSTGSGLFLRVLTSGGPYYDIAFNSFYVAFGFCI